MTHIHLPSFTENGAINFGSILDKQKCAELYEDVFNSREWSKNLFRSQEDVENDPQFEKTNPGKGVCNLAEKYDLSFIEDNEILKDHLEGILGRDYEIILKKFIVGVPEDWVPDWLFPLVSEQLVANLNPYIKPEFRDVTCLRGIDYHMDLIDHPDQTGEYVTLYVYLTDVDMGMSPLHLVEKSHMYGATVFPHCLKNEDIEPGTIEYGPDEDHMTKLNKKVLTGEGGTVYLWSSLTLHGTKPTKSDTSRISLRYTIKKNPDNTGTELIDDLLNSSEGHLTMEKTRDDIDLETFEQVKFNKILK